MKHLRAREFRRKWSRLTLSLLFLVVMPGLQVAVGVCGYKQSPVGFPVHWTQFKVLVLISNALYQSELNQSWNDNTF